MITLDKERCTKCGTCISMFKDFCISESDGYPVFDEQICNTCQKCVAICPARAIMVNGVYPDKMDRESVMTPDQLERFLERRRSTKIFRDKPVPHDVVERIVASAKYAPNQNKNIAAHVVTDRELLNQIDQAALGFVRTFRTLLFGFRPVTAFISLFTRGLPVIRKKMERDLVHRGSVVKKNAQVAIILTGTRKEPVTKHSAPYLMATMGLMAESLGVGTTLMDSLLLALRLNRKLRARLAITDDVLAVMLLGYSAEGIVNIPRGYEVDTVWHD